MDYIEEKILGCLVGAAAGDALGAATEMRTRRQIEEKFGGRVKEFLTPPDDTFARGNMPGQVTDDFSLAYVTCLEILRHNGEITPEVSRAALLSWAEYNDFFQRFAGPTTRAAVEELRGNKPPLPEGGFVLVNDNGKASNGGAMKISPVALFAAGDVDKAVRDAVVMCRWTHNNNIALSGATAVAAATAEAMKREATLQSVIDAGIYGAKKGFEIGSQTGKVLAGPSVEKRIQMAVEIGRGAGDMLTAMDEISDRIGCGLAAAEAVPASFGLLSAAKGDTMEAIYAGVNIGNDTDTIATMVGGILGALNGIGSLPKEYVEVLETKNNMDLRGMAGRIRGLMG